jgi:uncharacterized RDD family membrane protein YckC
VTQSTLDVATPEQVAVELPVAGVGSRAMAYLVDVALLFLGGLALYFAFTFLVPDPVNALLGLTSALKIASAVAVFAALWVYWTAFEVLWHGQTIGKRLLRIRVVRLDGSPVTAVDSAVRNLLRVVDFFPACYPVGLVTMLFDPKHRRVGDLVAGTLLVREEAIDLSRFEAPAAEKLSNVDLDVVTDFLRRFDALEPAARQSLGRQLLARLGAPAVGSEPLDDAALRARLEAKVKGA